MAWEKGKLECPECLLWAIPQRYCPYCGHQFHPAIWMGKTRRKDDVMMILDKIEPALLIGKVAGVNMELTPAQAGYLLQQARRAGKLRLALDKIYAARHLVEYDELVNIAMTAIHQDDREMEEGD